MSLSTLKKSNSLDKLLGAVQAENAPLEKKSYKDERLWKAVVDKSGNGYAVLRFLPAVEGEDMPWAKVWNHAFQGPTGQWYIENSLTTVGKNDPVSEMNSAYWNSGVNPFDFWEGANFKLKIRKVDGYWNYDKSEFASPSSLFDDDDQIEEVWKKQYPLSEFSADTNFKSYDELKYRLDVVLSGTTKVGNVADVMEDAPWVF